MARPDRSEYAAYYEKYVSLVPEEDIVEAMHAEIARTVDFLTGVSDREASVCHPPYTWTAKQVVGHLTDAERIFGYRALRIARGDSTPLPGFDENAYVQTAQFDRHPFADLVAEFQTVRQSQLILFQNLPTTAWSQRGIANGDAVSVRGLAYIIVGHERHHAAILRQRLSRQTS
jgi:DinB superfamily